MGYRENITELRFEIYSLNECQMQSATRIEYVSVNEKRCQYNIP